MSFQMPWQPSPDTIHLANDTVHVWLASLRWSARQIEVMQAGLSSREILRAQRFVQHRDADRYTVSHAILRKLLGRYLGVEPDTIGYSYNDYGKPYMQPVADHSDVIYFNMAYSQDLALYAFTRGNPALGIDIEHLRSDIDCQQLAQSVFTADEYTRLCQLADADRYRAFFKIWTRKEAYVKAQGQGLSLGLDSFDVSHAIGTAESSGLSEFTLLDRHAMLWTIKDLAISAQYAAAIAIRGTMPTLSYWHYMPT